MNTIQIQLDDKQYDYINRLLEELTEDAEQTPSYDYEMLVNIWRDVSLTKAYLWSSGCGRVNLTIPARHIDAIARPGNNEPACIAAIEEDGYLRRQLVRLDHNDIRTYLEEAGIYGVEENSESELKVVLLWLACHDINEERNMED